MKINETDILAALASYRSAADRPAGVFTTREGAEVAKLGTRAFADLLRKVKADGRLELVPVTVEGLNGRQTRVMAYRIRPAAKLKRA